MNSISGAALGAIGAGAPIVFAIILAVFVALFCWGGWPGRFVVLVVLAFLAGVPYSI